MRNLFWTFTEVLGWIRIAVIPFIVGSIIGAIVYGATKSPIGLGVGIFLSVLGLGLGIIWATRVWRNYGTMHFLSRIHATPDLDRKEEENKDEGKESGE